MTKGISIIGPRPALPAEVATYNDYQKQRLLVKPGITCYWQTRSYRKCWCRREGVWASPTAKAKRPSS
ncbi:MAG: sugar transferase [Coriobacteriaceae bacterium]|nr:sugar transferase [Coriobacteriaceae bacterium]